MGKLVRKQANKFNTKLLKKLKNTEKSGVKSHTTIQHLAIHPCQLNNFNESVKMLLNEKITKYNNEFNGILLGYKNIKLLKDGGVIHEDSCYIHFDITAEFFIFKPEIGQIMQGVVKRKSKDHLGILVYEAFNVSIPIYDEDNDENSYSINANIGDEVTFQILYINLASHLPYIRGKLISISSEETDINTEKTIINTKETKKEDLDSKVEVKKKQKKKIKISVVGENF